MVDLRLHFFPSYRNDFILKERIETIFSGNLEGVRKIESSQSAEVYYFETETHGEKKGYYYKEFLFRHFRDRLSVLFRPSRGVRACRGGRLLLDHGFDTALPVCSGELKRFGVVLRSLMVTESIPFSAVLADYLERYISTDTRDGVSAKRRLLLEYGKVIGRLHREGIFQGDLRERNVLIKKGDSPRFFLIDNERTRQYTRLPTGKRLKNLVQANMHRTANITRTDRVRFFYAYLAENPELLPYKRKWMRKILRKTRYRLRRKGRL